MYFNDAEFDHSGCGSAKSTPRGGDPSSSRLFVFSQATQTIPLFGIWMLGFVLEVSEEVSAGFSLGISFGITSTHAKPGVCPVKSNKLKVTGADAQTNTHLTPDSGMLVRPNPDF